LNDSAVEMARSKILLAWTAHRPQLRQNILHGYFAFRGKISAETILRFVKHDWLKWSWVVTSTI